MNRRQAAVLLVLAAGFVLLVCGMPRKRGEVTKGVAITDALGVESQERPEAWARLRRR